MTNYTVLAPVVHTDHFTGTVEEGSTAIRIVTIKDFASLYNISNIDVGKIFIFATNANGTLTDVHIDGTTILGDYIYAVFDRPLPANGTIKINYCLMYFA
ncbi:hypothetical protein [Candidatus Stoquefichus massiliensis]|uniref:hypothetical protein n=1 Tax=Candidatus Stoquefichus massiliensis TaxID=1470350 RepID=UPI000486D3D7|nr:hypothetical protein [Candidatus Stoquefichus massiliensis]